MKLIWVICTSLGLSAWVPVHPAVAASSAQAQVSSPRLTPPPPEKVEPSDGPWTCMTTCGGPKEGDRKVQEALHESEKNCSGKGAVLGEAVADLKNRLDLERYNDTTHEPLYECSGCVKTDLNNAVCKNGVGATHPYRELAKTKSRLENHTTSP